jgi:peptidoglycan hydrolase CwlO-like protein
MSQTRIPRALRAAAQLGVLGVVAIAASLISTAPASADYQTQISSLQQQQSELLSQLASLEGQAASAGQQAAATQTQITAIQQKLSQDQTELSTVTAQLNATDDQLTSTEAQMARDRSQLAALVTVLYQRDANDSFASAIADSSSISKLVDDTVDLQTVRQRFDSLTKQLIADANALKVLQAQQQAQQQQVATLVAGLQSQENQLQAAENTFTSEQGSLTGQAAQISAQIQSISGQIEILQEEDAAASGGGSLGYGGTILAVYSGYPNLGPYPDDYPQGQCTWFAASEAYIDWSANADGWIAGDANSPHPYPIGMTPQVGSIVVWRGGGAYSSLGHVAWVVAVSGSAFTVDEVNYVSPYDEDQRYVPNTDGVMGFLYPN